MVHLIQSFCSLCFLSTKSVLQAAIVKKSTSTLEHTHFRIPSWTIWIVLYNLKQWRCYDEMWETTHWPPPVEQEFNTKFCRKRASEFSIMVYYISMWQHELTQLGKHIFGLYLLVWWWIFYFFFNSEYKIYNLMRIQFSDIVSNILFKICIFKFPNDDRQGVRKIC